MNNISEWDKEYCRNIRTERYQEIDNYWWKNCYDEIESFLTKNLDINHDTKILEAGSGSGNYNGLINLDTKFASTGVEKI
jgi:hypothetical protein